jgi:hypothetical protein
MLNPIPLMLFEPRKCGVQTKVILFLEVSDSDLLSKFMHLLLSFALRDKGTQYLYHIRGVSVANK